MSQRLELGLPGSAIDEFSDLLQSGVRLSSREGRSVSALLVEDLGLDRRAVAERIGTVILDGRPVDDIDETLLTDGCTLSLSAAMPGLVGATLRRGGPLRSMRSSISGVSRATPSGESEISITLKLFNLLVGELGPTVLRQGISLTGDEMRSFIRKRLPAFREACRGMTLDGIDIDRRGLERDIEDEDQETRYVLSVVFSGG